MLTNVGSFSDQTVATFHEGNNEGRPKVCIQVKWLIGPELNLVSVA